ncbi:hypothetical protein HY78_00975 [Rhizorhabdus wittichii DC-6]|nr:hypothetical protein HY78_00975 [Rhizorhabdus wittichii DC-6]
MMTPEADKRADAFLAGLPSCSVTERLETATLLPPSEWRVAALDDRHFAVAILSRRGVAYWQRWRISDFPNSFFGIEDLERAGVLGIYVAAIEQFHGGPAS